MAAVDQLNALVSAVQQDVVAIQKDVQDVLVLLQGQSTEVDLSDAIAKLTAVHEALATANTALDAATGQVDGPPEATA